MHAVCLGRGTGCCSSDLVERVVDFVLEKILLETQTHKSQDSMYANLNNYHSRRGAALNRQIIRQLQTHASLDQLIARILTHLDQPTVTPTNPIMLFELLAVSTLVSGVSGCVNGWRHSSRFHFSRSSKLANILVKSPRD